MSSRRSASSSAKGPSLAPVFLAIGALLVAAVAVAVMQSQAKKAKEQEQATESKQDDAGGSNPFGDIDNSPKGYGSGGKLTDTAPAGLADKEPYASARAAANEGIALIDEAVKARNEGDEATYQTKGKAGQVKLEEALFATTDWLLELQDLHPTDRQLARIESERGKWQRAYKKVRKIE